MKDKIKKFFSKDNLFILICTLLIGLFVLLSVLFYKKDVNNVNENKHANINLVEDQNILNTSWSIDSNGNLIGVNLLNTNIIETVNGSFEQSSSLFTKNGFGNTLCDLYFFKNTEIVDIKRGINGVQYFTITYSTSDLTQLALALIGNSTDSYLYINFSLLQSGVYTISGYFNPNNFNDSSLSYLMLNVGSSSLDWEPYGIWYSKSNYDSLDNQLNIISGNINPLSANNISSNTLVLNSIDITSELGGSIFLSDINGGLGFYNTDFDSYSSFNSSGVNEFNLVSIFNNTYTIFGCTAFVSFSHSAEDYIDISIYRDNQLILFMNDLDSETTQEYMQTYSNQEIEFNKIIISGRYSSSLNDRQGKNYLIDNNNYAFGYQQGYKDSSMFYDSENTRLVRENSQLSNDLNNLDTQYTTLNNSYNSLLSQYNSLANNEYTFSELFWSISSVPFGVLASGFNVNVLGVNLAAIITGLFTALLIIWLIKKFLK